MAEPTLAESLGEFAAATTYSRLPAEVVASVRERVLDTLGICVAATALDTSRSAQAWITQLGGEGKAHVVGSPALGPASSAAFVNGVLAHSLDYDDTHLPSVLHPSASVIPAALAAAETAGADGQQVIAAIAAGLEVCVRLGMAGYDEAARNSTYFDHGQHATSICGAVGSAVAAALLGGADAPGIVNALAIACSMGSGVIEANRTGGTVKRMHCGWAAHAGVAAAELAALGFSGPPTVLEGRFGFFQAWLHGHFDRDAVTSQLGEAWAVPGIFFKPYPANHFTHTAVDAAAALRRRGLRPDEVASATLGIAAPTLHTIGEPIEVKRSPATGYMAQFSGPYAVATGLFGGSGLGAGLEDYTDALAADPQRRSLMQRVSVVADDRCTAVFPGQFPAVLRVRTTAGEDLVAEVMTNRGGPQRPLSYDELLTKFRDNVSRFLPTTRARQFEDKVASLEDVLHIAELLEPLATSLTDSRHVGETHADL